MMDLDLGMNNWMSDAFKYPTTPITAGKLLTAAKLKELGDGWGRYKDVDGDGIPYRTNSGRRHASVLHGRGSGHNAQGQYSERPDDYVENMDGLSRKFETARKHVPAPVRPEQPESEIGFIGYGTSHFRDRRAPRPAAGEAARRGIPLLPYHVTPAVRFDRAQHRRTSTSSQQKTGRLRLLDAADPALFGREMRGAVADEADLRFRLLWTTGAGTCLRAVSNFATAGPCFLEVIVRPLAVLPLRCGRSPR